jgi:hypothetical protein
MFSILNTNACMYIWLKSTYLYVSAVIVYYKKNFMNITAGQVQKSCTGAQVLEQQIKTISKTFQSEIIEASKNGSTSVIVAVPTNFNIVNMNNKTAQTIIYHRLIEELEDNGFHVKISMNTSSVSYCIRWDLEKDSGDMKKMRDTIASHLT